MTSSYRVSPGLSLSHCSRAPPPGNRIKEVQDQPGLYLRIPAVLLYSAVFVFFQKNTATTRRFSLNPPLVQNGRRCLLGEIQCLWDEAPVPRGCGAGPHRHLHGKRGLLPPLRRRCGLLAPQARVRLPPQARVLLAPQAELGLPPHQAHALLAPPRPRDGTRELNPPGKSPSVPPRIFATLREA